MISFRTLAELDRSVLDAKWGEARRKHLCEYLERFVVLPYDRVHEGAEVTVAAQASGRRIDCADAWIAATALLAGVPLITQVPRIGPRPRPPNQARCAA